jgi:phosphoribosylglycinamide formyltransferase-1
VEVGAVICNKPRGKAGVYERIDRLNAQYHLGIEVVNIGGATHPLGNVGRGQTLAESEAICEYVAKHNFSHVCLMGYMKMVRGALMEEYGWNPKQTSIYECRATNNHPGPLPETADKHSDGPSALVLDLGLEYSAHTLQLLAPEIDQGPIIAEHPVRVLEGDTAQTLFDRVQVAEKTGLPYALDKFLREQAEYSQTKGVA